MYILVLLIPFLIIIPLTKILTVTKYMMLVFFFFLFFFLATSKFAMIVFIDNEPQACMLSDYIYSACSVFIGTAMQTRLPHFHIDIIHI